MTFKDIDTVHKRAEGTARRNFNTHKAKLIEGENYFVRNSYEAKVEFGITAPNGLILITESGYLLLVKSLNDDLAWDVQRMLVKSYFRNKSEAQPSVPKEDAQLARAKAMLLNAKTRAANTWLKIAATVNIPEYKQIASTYAANTLADREVLALPQVERKTYTATEIGKMFDVSGKKIGQLANEHGLKTKEYGMEVWDKARHSGKQIPAWRYYENAIPVFAKLLGKEVA